MSKKIVLLVFALAAFCVVRPGIVAGQGAVQDKDPLKPMIADCEDCVRSWERSALAFTALTIVIGVLGIVSSSLQKLKGKRIVMATALVGILISATTLVNNTLFSGEDRQRAAEGNVLLSEIRFLLFDGYHPETDDARAAWILQIRDRIIRIQNLRRAGSSRSVRAGLRLPTLAAPLYAQSASPLLPPWIAKPPQDPRLMRFVGVAEAPVLDQARAASLQNARDEAARRLALEFDARLTTRPPGVDTGAIARYLVGSGSVENVHFQFRDELKLYRFFTLFALSRDALMTDLGAYAALNKTAVPGALYAALKEPPGAEGDQIQLQIKRQEILFNASRSELTPDENAAFLEARQVRSEGRPQDARPALERVVAAKPAFGGAWRELALACEALGDAARAEEAFRKALELATSGAGQDPSLVLDYAGFLIRQSRVKEAVLLVDRAAAAQPENLELARFMKALKEIR
jgi:tetratricopeptide (TPR) repeat protein